MTSTPQQIADEITELRAQLSRMEERLEALQADWIKLRWSELFRSKGEGPFTFTIPPPPPFEVAPKMGVRMFAHPVDFEDEGDWLDEDDEDA